MNNRKIIIIALAAVLVVAAGIGLWYWRGKQATPTAPTANTPATSTVSVTNSPTTSVTQEASKSIGATIFEKTQDPLKTKIPETNPLKRVIVNPF